MGTWYEEAHRKSRCARCPRMVEEGQRIYMQRRGVYLCEPCGSVAEHEEPEVGDVESGVLEDLKQLPPEAAGRTLAKMMIVNAKRIDMGDVADRDIAGLEKEMRTQLLQLQMQFPAEPEDDETEQARKRRERRIVMDDNDY